MFRAFTQELLILYYAVNDKRTPFYAKWVALLAFVYLISPIDLIPDFIPFVGYLDDLVIVPFVLHIAFRLLPAQVKQDSLMRARKHMAKLRLIFAGLIMLLLAIMVGIFFLVKSVIHHL
jgi:uncharacterized membrane protein YkvA (DUF1232 family)